MEKLSINSKYNQYSIYNRLSSDRNIRREPVKCGGNNMRSCDTMIAMNKATSDGNVIFGKNSDRPLNEAQPLCFFPAADHMEGEEVQCSFIRIPQVKHTYACIGSKPHVFFGFEHGVNEHGVMIGNEQVSGREAPERRWGLIGMDILRLALERANTAGKAVEVIANLLESFGTGGDPNTRIRPFNSNYIIADSKEAYIFESHQRSWVAKRVDNVGYISNCYSIQENYDLISSNAVNEAKIKGWLHPDEEKFNPAKAWTIDNLLYGEAEGFMRYARLGKLMESREPFTVKMMMNNLRDHYDDEPLCQTIFSKAASKIPTICSHPGGINGCVTAASAVTVLRSDVPEELRFTYWSSMAPPCCSVFRPFYNIGWLPEEIQNAHAIYEEKEHWWIFTELERYVELNYEKFAPKVKETFNEMENRFIEEATYIERNYTGNRAVLMEFSKRTAGESYNAARNLINDIKSKLKTRDLDRMLLSYFREAAATCGMPYDKELIE